MLASFFNSRVVLATVVATTLLVAFVNCGEQGIGSVGDNRTTQPSAGVKLNAGPGNGRIFEGKVQYVHIGYPCESGYSSEIISDHDRLFIISENCSRIEPRPIDPRSIVHIDSNSVRVTNKVYFDKGHAESEQLKDTLGNLIGNADVSSPSTKFTLLQNRAVPIDHFQCRLDSSDWARCDQMAAYQNIGPGQHSFETRSVDSAGAIIAIDSFEWANGGWSAYGSWGACSKSCGGGTRQRQRSCTAPAPENGGYGCTGNATEQKACNTKLCKTSCGSPRGPQWGCKGNKKNYGNRSESACIKLCENAGRTCCGYHVDGHCTAGDSFQSVPGCSGCRARSCK